MNIHPLWNSYPSLKKELEATLDIMQTSINLANKDVETLIIEMIRSGGKLLRPAYLILFSKFGKHPDTDKIIALAASIETLHTATLIHDDIIDEANTRRNLPTVQAKFGTDVAVYAGDYLFVSCFKILAHHASSIKSMELNINSMEKILNGELGQMDHRYNYHMTTEDYIKNISGKTAELFSLSCFLGAYEGNASNSLAQKAKEIGLNIGLAFQVLDDILDYSQSSDLLGKPVLEDMTQGVYSLPLLCAMKTHSSKLKPLLDKKEAMTSEDTHKVYEIVHQANGVTEAYKIAKEFTNNALKMINKLPSDKNKTKQMLESITLNLLNRDY